MPPTRYPILYVDDERENLITFRYAVEERFDVLTAQSGAEALSVLERDDVAVLLSDQRMPGMSGIELCEAAKQLRPDVVRIIITAYSDLQVAVQAINRGQVARFLTKPWQDAELVQVLSASVELAQLQQTVRDMQVRLLRQGEPRAIDALRAEFARQLRVPVDSLQINTEQVSDLLGAGLQSWSDLARARELIESAQVAHGEASAPLEALRMMGQKLARRERLDRLPEPAVADAARVVRAVVQILESAVEPHVELRAVLEAAPLVPMDAAELGHILTELIGNAGRATTHVKNVVTITVGGDDAGARITVSDTGRGIDPDRLERIFDPYVAEDEVRQGLGLALVRQLMTAAGGSVRADNAPGGGARFTLSFPARKSVTLT